MISTREIADDNTSISSTRWSFATVVKFDIVVIFITLISYIVGHFVGKPFDSGLASLVALLLGILTGLVSALKGAQGFEPQKDKKDVKENA